MTSQSNIKKAKRKLDEVVALISTFSDEEMGVFLSDNTLGKFVQGILDPNRSKEYPNIQEFFLHNKNATMYIARLQDALCKYYCLHGKVQETGQEVVASPFPAQWFDDGVMFLQGRKPFAGILGYYRNNGEIRFAIMARDKKGPGYIEPNDVEFLSIDDYKTQLAEQETLKDLSQIDEPLHKLKELLSKTVNDESQYQELFANFPWIVSLHHRKFSRHEKLDDKNIPDFTGVRVRDKARDIFEIKPPFMPIMRQDGEFSSDFNSAWNQAERYLLFCQRQSQYLYSEKGLYLDNPKCYLIIGYELSDAEIKQIRAKNSFNSHIELLTYNNLLTTIQETINFIKQMSSSANLED